MRLLILGSREKPLQCHRDGLSGRPLRDFDKDCQLRSAAIRMWAQPCQQTHQVPRAHGGPGRFEPLREHDLPINDVRCVDDGNRHIPA